MKEKVIAEVKKTFRPEFLNRIDGIVVFHSLNRQQIRDIVELMLKNVLKNLESKSLSMTVSDAAKDFLGEKGYDTQYGARPLRRVIQNMVEDQLSEMLLQGKFTPGDKVSMDIEDGQLVIKKVEAALANSRS